MLASPAYLKTLEDLGCRRDDSELLLIQCAQSTGDSLQTAGSGVVQEDTALLSDFSPDEPAIVFESVACQ